MINLLETAINMSMEKASASLTKMLGTVVKIRASNIEQMSAREVSTLLPQDLKITGGLVNLECKKGLLQFLLLIDDNCSRLLTDYFLRNPAGTKKERDELVNSTVQEIANLMASTVSNVFSSRFGFSILPSPPEVVNSYASGALEFLLYMNPETDAYYIARTVFELEKDKVPCYLFLQPDSSFCSTFHTGGKT